MPDFIPFLPFFPGGGGGGEDTYPGIGPLIDELLRRRQLAQPAPPSPDQPTPPEPEPTPTVPPLPIASAEFALVAQLPYAFAQASRASPKTSESRSLAASFAQAYGNVPLRMRRAKKMARNKRTMRAQEDVFTPIDPRSLPVPVDRAQTPQEFDRAIRDRGAELERLKREQDAARRPAQTLPNEPPPRTRSRGGRLTPIFDPFSLTEDVGTIIGDIAGELIGEAKYGQTTAEQDEAARIKKELDERMRRETAPFPDEILGPGGVPTGEVKFKIPPKFPGIDYENIGGVMVKRAPRMPAPSPAPPQPRRSRAARALTRVQNAMRNPWAYAGVLGLGIISPRKRSSSSMPLAARRRDRDDEILTTINPGMLPFTAPSGFGAIPPSVTASSNCDCKPKRRGPKRRCLERAQVAWKTGRYKGKNAGTRCVRWE